MTDITQQLRDLMDLDNITYTTLHANSETQKRAREILNERKANYERKYQEVYFYSMIRVGDN